MKKKIITELLKILVTAVATALGMSVVEGCAVVPFFNF